MPSKLIHCNTFLLYVNLTLSIIEGIFITMYSINNPPGTIIIEPGETVIVHERSQDPDLEAAEINARHIRLRQCLRNLPMRRGITTEQDPTTEQAPRKLYSTTERVPRERYSTTEPAPTTEQLPRASSSVGKKENLRALGIKILSYATGKIDASTDKQITIGDSESIDKQKYLSRDEKEKLKQLRVQLQDIARECTTINVRDADKKFNKVLTTAKKYRKQLDCWDIATIKTRAQARTAFHDACSALQDISKALNVESIKDAIRPVDLMALASDHEKELNIKKA